MSSGKWKTWEHPLTGASFAYVIGMLWKNGFGKKPIYLFRISFILVTAAFLSPFRLLERILFARKIRRHKLKTDPIFILGHWRSGTTYLHSMFTQDENFGYMNTFEAFVPDAFIVGKYFLKPISRIFLPSKRPMDAVHLGPDSPQEEEFAIANQTSLSFYQCLYFPEQVVDSYSRYIFYDSLTLDERIRWEKAYSFILKKISFEKNGKQLVLKNPMSTGKIEGLLKLYPNAKFVYISRKKEDVLVSTISMNTKLLELYSLKDYTKETIEKFAIEVHQKLMDTYRQDKSKIASENLIEINYIDFISNPVSQMDRIYKQFELKDFEKASVKFKQYFESQKSYQPNKYPKAK